VTDAMRRLFVAAALIVAVTMGLPVSGQSPAALRSAEPFKLGTFDINGTPTAGLLLRDTIVVDLPAANREYQRRGTVARMAMPSDMLSLIGQYEYGVQRRIYEIVNALVAANRLAAGAARPAYISDASKVRALAPIQYPSKLLHAAGNYYGHVGENATPEEQKKEAEARRRDRGTPYLFLKPTLGAIVGTGDDILLPRGRDKIDWECELGVVIGRPAKYVTKEQAKDYIFGYTIILDMSDRGGRPEKQSRFGGSDWFIGKGHDTFAPMGPYIVPKEFYGDPMNVRQLLTVNGKTMQDSRSTDMIHNIYELIEYGSSVMTLFPGDAIAAGSPAGTGMSRSVRPEQTFLKAGDKIVATIDGIGTMTHTAVADQPAVPTTSSQE
jgi:2-keto-4-pentenoate hydratase/2-oxohepta-3-ene-1,7-dioic acid hydratase in catechol pathway